MSLALRIAHVTHVLLADGWHELRPESFDLDAYEFIGEDELIYNGERQGCSTGFTFTLTDGTRVSGPITSVLAVRHALPKWP